MTDRNNVQGDWTGELLLSAERRQGKTVASDVYFQGAFKLMRPFYPDDTGQMSYYLLNPGGGYVDGDRYRIKLDLAEDAQLLFTTQSATKIYRTPNKAVFQETEVTLKAGSLLELLPDPLIAYRAARYKQKNVIRMETGATFISTDIITSGWSPDGEQFKYDKLQLKTEIYLDDELAVLDHLKLDPQNPRFRGLGAMEGYTHLGTMIAVGEQANANFIDRLHGLIAAETGKPSYKIGLSQLAVPGVTIRVLATSTQQIERVFALCHRFIREAWFGKTAVLLRKY